MVYVLSVDGKPLMPTTPAKARILLKQKKAIVKTVKPFTIQLTYKTKFGQFCFLSDLQQKKGRWKL